ncbi:MAG: carbohydrate-binding domain-containing protein, partial [Bacilli bacterium]|nr:carbohydrate-binding domain-containing protein [Bacilli bacterium]
GPGGMEEGNTDKGDHSTKGIKAANQIVINSGVINIKSYDDAIHANNDTTLENGELPLGNIVINNGAITVYSNDDGLHADGYLVITSGVVDVTNAYEGIEGSKIVISGGKVSVISKDDGFNATTTSGAAVTISGGDIYIYCTGDGIDSNSRTSDVGISISGGNTIVISNSGMNSALDTEKGYSYTAGSLVAIMPRGGMLNESTDCNNFTSVGKYTTVSLTTEDYLVVGIKDTTATIKSSMSSSVYVIVLGDNSPSITKENFTSKELDKNGVAWD